MNEDRLKCPTVDARRRCGWFSFAYGEVLIVICPHCGKNHAHGTVVPRGPVGCSDGHRNADCGGEYIIREVPAPADAIAADENPRRISPALRARVMERDDFRCRRCGSGPRDARLVIDHVVPVAAGGTGVESNLQTLCEDCNSGKSDRPPHPHDLAP